VSGVVFATATPPLDFHLGILLGLVGFALVLETERSPLTRWSAACGWLFGMGANSVALRFVPDVVLRFTALPSVAAYASLVLLSAAQAIPWAVGAAIAQALVFHVPRARVPRWLAFGLGVYAATFIPVVFPWTPAGGLAPWPLLLQIADVVGERGVTFLLGCAAGLVARAIAVLGANRRRAYESVGAAAGVLAIMLGYGALRTRAIGEARAAAPTARVALLQPGFDASDRWEASRATMMIERLSVLTRNAEQRGAELTVWPESAYPFTLPHATRRSPVGPRAFLQDGVRGPVLTGVYMSGAPGTGYNSAVLVTSDHEVSIPYDKRHLLAFGEAVPLGEAFPWLKRAFTKGSALSPGHESVAFTTGPLRMAVLNCFEDTLPEAGREAMEAEPNLLVNITNDAWFVESAESELHLRLAVLRSIETRRDLVRAVNRGPTTFVDATGRVRARYDLPMPGALHATPALLTLPPTLYVRFGDLPWVLLAAASVLAPLARARLQNVAGAASREGRAPDER